MLQSIRDNLTGPIVWVVIGLITVPFAIWGIDSFFTGGTDPTVAKVGSTKITQSQFRAAYEQSYRQQQLRMGENFRADAIDQTLLRKGVLDAMVQQSLLRQAAHSAGYRANDATMLTEISSAFQKDGHFSREDYDRFLKMRGMTVDRFEAQIRESMTVDALRDTVLSSAFVVPVEAAGAARLENQQREFRSIALDAAKYGATVTVTDEQIRQRYEEKKDSFMAPERVRLAYIELAQDQMPPAAAPATDVLKSLYDANKDSRFTTPEQRKASHILIAAGTDKAAAKKKAEDLLAQLRKGADFAALAKANSDDPGSKAQGGSLGAVRRGIMTQPFEDRLFAMTKPGEISEPVETQYGWHLIRLDELVAAHTEPFESAGVQQQLLDMYRQSDAKVHYEESSKKIEDAAFENANSLDAAAKVAGLKVQTTDWLTRAGGPGIAANPAVLAAAFSPELIKDGENSKPIGTAPGHIVVVRKADYEAPRQRELAEVSSQIRDTLRNEQAAARLKADADAIVAELTGGKGPDEVAKAHGLAASAPAASSRAAGGQDPAVLAELFRMPRPTAGKPSIGQAKTAQGVSVLDLLAVRDDALPTPAKTPRAAVTPADTPVELPAPTPADAAARSSAQLRDAAAGAEFAAYRADLEKRIKVDIRQKVADDATAPGP